MPTTRKKAGRCRWRALVRVSGVPVITEAELTRMAALVPGSIRHEKGHRGGNVTFDWRFFMPDGLDADDAVSVVSEVWRAAIAHVESAKRPVCTDFRVFRAHE